MLLSSYRNSRGSLAELEKAVEIALLVLFPQNFSFSDMHSRFFNSIETLYIFERIFGQQILSIKDSFVLRHSLADVE